MDCLHSGVFLFAPDAETPSLSVASTALQAEPQPTDCCRSNYKTYCQNRDREMEREQRESQKWREKAQEKDNERERERGHEQG